MLHFPESFFDLYDCTKSGREAKQKIIAIVGVSFVWLSYVQYC